MCGRTAQTRSTVMLAAQNLGFRSNNDVSGSSYLTTNNSSNQNPYKSTTNSTAAAINNTTNSAMLTEKDNNNYNISPGMEATVFVKDDDDGIVRFKHKHWGLITRPGTMQNPHQKGNSSAAYSALMFNARSETIFAKQTFSTLLSKQRSCLIAVDGWFEWKQELKGQRKQPYFIKAKSENNYCLLPGLWTEVCTGRGNEILSTFTILTTKSIPCLEWLHHRMPVCCWSKELALQWLNCPNNPSVHKAILNENRKYSSAFEWYPVTKEMSKPNFRSPRAIMPEKKESVKSFFTTTTTKPKNPYNNKSVSKETTSTKQEGTIKSTQIFPSIKKVITPMKRPADGNNNWTVKKRIKQSNSKGSISSFFLPKKV